MTAMEALDSKGIRWIRYDERNRTLDVAYTGSGEYRYFDVEPEVYGWLTKVDSKGKFVNRLVKEKYRYERLDVAQSSSEEGDLERLLRDSLQPSEGEADNRSAAQNVIRNPSATAFIPPSSASKPNAPER
jgi:hypothetical protein